VQERRVSKSSRKTLNDRRVAGTGSSRPESAHGEPAPATTTAGTRTTAKAGLSEELVRLACLCQAGVLTDAEFEAAKARTIDQYRNSLASE
jgi:hypothetical protein